MCIRDRYEWDYDLTGTTFLPTDFDQVVTHPVDPTNLFSTGLSSVQVLPNDNLLITSGRFGYTFEVTPNNEIVWEYKTPRNGTAPATQGDTLAINNNLTFRMKRYPSDFAAFDGKDLSSKGWIELEPDTAFCDMLTSSVDPMLESNFKVYPNPATNFLTIEWDGMMYVDMEVIDMVGRQIESIQCNGGKKYIDTSDWVSGVYFISFIVENTRYSRKVIISN